MNKTYRDVYEDAFLNCFKLYKDDIAQLPWDGESSIDIDEIIKICNITVVREFGRDSGSCQPPKNTINVNMLEPSYRQRFTLAHELGHLLLGHEGGYLYRTSDTTKYPSAISQVYEREANRFAAELLMPEFLMNYFLDKVFEEKNMSMDGEYGSVDTQFIISLLADKLKVSSAAVEIRLQNLGMMTVK